ncbi:MAG TPA: hypothetical protein VK048_04175, partial [Atopostipes sp.]|nr:hypothetical protein [Atopostipes sp.]
MKKKMESTQPNVTNQQGQQLTFREILEEPVSPVQELQEEDNDEKRDSDLLYPIQLVRDFERFIHYLEKHQVQITKTKSYISRKYLPDINRKLSIQ